MYRVFLVLFTVLICIGCHTTQSGTTTRPEVENPRPTTSATVTAVQELTDDNFSEKMKKGTGLRMAYFTASWCGPCRVLGPTVDKVSASYQGKVLMGKMDVDANYADAFNNVTTVPTILFFKDGEEVFRTMGIVSEEYLTTVIDRLL